VIEINGMAHVILTVSRFDLARAFYGRLLPEFGRRLGGVGGAAILTIGFLSTLTLVEAQLSESPIAPGFWSFPTHKAQTAKDVLATCRDYFEIRFADGHFLGVKIQKTERSAVQRQVAKVGRCSFSRDTQVETCSVRMTNYDGSVLAGTLRSKYSLDGNTLTVRITPEMVTDSASENSPYEAFPVRCPDDALWSILNESTSLR
jgi:hypothetical protein